jgi:hypothetical protein
MMTPEKTPATPDSNQLSHPKVTVFDPAMCCSTGVCGPDVDDSIINFASDVKWLKNRNVEVTRHNLGQEPQAFKANAAVLAKLQAAGSGCLPIVEIDGEIVSEGRYPTREELGRLTGLSA